MVATAVVVNVGSVSSRLRNSSKSMVVGRPGRASSWSEKFPLRKRLNRSVAVVFPIEPGPNALQRFVVSDAEWPSLYS